MESFVHMGIEVKSIRHIIIEIDIPDEIGEVRDKSDLPDEWNENSVQLYVRPWVATEGYWDIKFEIIELIKLEFDKNDISIPFPKMDFHIQR